MLLSWKQACLLATVWLQVPRLVQGAEYKLAREYSGDSFFDGWTFFDARESDRDRVNVT